MILLEVDSLVKHYGPEPVLAGASFEIRPGDRVSLVGPNGAGKTTLLKIIAGREDADSGTCVLHASARLAYLEQQPEFASGRTVWDETYDGLAAQVALVAAAEQAAHDLAAATAPGEHARLAARYDRLQHEIARRGAYQLDRQVEQVLLGLGFARETFAQPVAQLSGGQQNRLLLARLLLAGADLLLLDEPSNHLDIEATEWLEGFLSESRQAMLIVSHDRYFLDKVSNRTFELFDGTIDEYPGNFSAYWRQKQERLEVAARTYEKQQEYIARTEEFIRRNFAGQKSNQAEDRRKKLARIERVAPPRTIAAPPMAFPPAERSGDLVLRVEHLAKAYARPLFADLTWDVIRGERWGILGPNGSGKTTLLRCLIGDERPDEGMIALGTGVRLAYYDQLLSGVADDAQVVDAIRPPHKEFTEPERRTLLARFGLRGDIVFQKVKSLSGGERSRAALARLASLDANVLVLDEPTNHLDLWARDALERALLEFDGTL
ncbi:MAG: ABC-F family ATP-binding cassette domain-containing protein, partial [Planctomycetaceae bacterium]|nr:ABC-F family ATP-binding cassette domain-containing protein [Planctomycetaceae bacterium]